MASLSEHGFLSIGPQRLDYRMVGPQPAAAPTLVLLHEGLGSAAMWGDFPERLQAATGLGVFAYSRAGYGRSSAAASPRAVTFMPDEAREVLPRVLDAIGFRRGLLVGHSDGASIAAIYGGSFQDHRVGGLVLMAPHVVVEDVTLAGIAATRKAYDRGGLRQLARYHDDMDAAVRGWSDVWLRDDFRKWDLSEELAYIRVPMLIVQGEGDQYGTAHQIEVVRDECYCPVEVLMLPGVKHVPHREAPDKTLAAIADFAARALAGQGTEKES
jgi:pimeloyl-ACP methyl ester carboxylesterase